MFKRKIGINTIQGKKYHYIHDDIYINKGKIRRTSASLGPLEKSTEESIKIRKYSFIMKMIAEEISLRTQYWVSRAKEVKVFPFEKIYEMEDQRTQLYRAKEDLSELSSSAMETAFLIDFIYNSNKIEGSRLGKSQVQEYVKEGVKKNEVANTILTIRQLSKKFPISVNTLVKLHAILLSDEPQKHGLRNTPILVGDDQSVASPDDIKTELKKLFSWFQDNKFKIYPPELAFMFYFKFERIHPFQDGNGRLGRLLMNQILKESRYHPIIIWNRNRKAHFSSFKRGAEGHIRPFLDFMKEQYLKTYEIYIKKIGPAQSFDEQIKTFLTPSDY